MRNTALLIAIGLLSACDNAPVIDVAGESLVGQYVEDGRVAAFLGVPFADPPVGALRWRAPQPVSTKRAKRRVREFAPACMQTMRILDWYRSMAVQFGGSEDYYEDLEVSEDCLYLNIWTAALETDRKLPVMVWIHGGSNKSGWSYEPNYHGHKLAQEGVVVVSVAYRQGVFGFLSHPEMPAAEPAANFALWDIVAALRWIRLHIAEFGGDPERVTLFGESAGAQNILALMFADAADGLFHRAVLQSTAGFGLRRMSTLRDEQMRGLGLAAALGLPEEGSLAALRQVPADRVLDVYTETFPDHYHAPATDGQLLRNPTWESLHRDDWRGRELIIGTNDHEWYSSIPESLHWEDVDYGSAVDIVRDEADPRRAMDRLRTAATMLCPSQHAAALANTRGAKAHMYHFTRVREDAAGKSLGAYHGAEYPYVFGTHDAYMTTSGADLELQAVMQRYWTQFAASGNPNSGHTPDWPRFERPELLVQELGDRVFTKSAPEPELCARFEDWLTTRATD